MRLPLAHKVMPPRDVLRAWRRPRRRVQPVPCLGGSDQAMAAAPNDERRGVVLVAVLWSIALLSALAMAASTTFRGFAGIMVVDRDRVQGDALLTAGLH